MLKTTCLAILLSSTITTAQAANTPSAVEIEITQLIKLVESSGCTFYRNGSSHVAEDAADHLRLKLRRGSRYAKTTKDFIENLASQSSWSKKPYFIECANNEKVMMSNWLNTQLQKIHSTEHTKS